MVVLTDGEAAQHAQTYAHVIAHLDKLLGYQSDPSCKDISRGHFVSWDPAAEYHEVTKPFATCKTLQTEEVIEPPFQPTAHRDATLAEIQPSALSQEEVETFVRSYLTLYPAREGNRNNQLFRMGCEARKRGIDRGALCRVAVCLMAGPDFDGQEIASVVKSVYSRKNTDRVENGEKMGHFMAQSTLNHPLETSVEDVEDENNDGEELREHYLESNHCGGNCHRWRYRRRFDEPLVLTQHNRKLLPSEKREAAFFVLYNSFHIFASILRWE